MLTMTALWRSAHEAANLLAVVGLVAALTVLVPPTYAQLERLPAPTEDSNRRLPSVGWAEEQKRWSNLDDVEIPRSEPWRWHVLPPGLVYRSYLAGVKESRFASYWNWEQDHGALWDITLGGRVAILRYGTVDPLLPRGYELQIEGAAFPRLDPNANMDLQSVDFRFGIPLAYSHGPWEFKFAYYHLSSHLGDELMIRNPSIQRINYSRDALVLGTAYRWTPDVRLYAEAAWAFHIDGGALPWEFQFGAEYSPLMPTGFRPLPFLAVNGYLREDVNYGGNFVAQAGLQWRSAYNGGRFRFGVEYFNGKSCQFEFFRQFEQQIGLGLWYDY
jgi:hypothetical protein